MAETSPTSDEAAQRRRIRRFGVGLLLLVAGLAAAAVGYVELFGHVLRDPSRPPSVTSPDNPRVLAFEIVFLALVLAAFSFVLVRLIRHRRDAGKEPR